MKALKSKLASDLLADPHAKEWLRLYLTNKQPDTANAHQPKHTLLRRANGMVIRAVVVPKA